jgi:hypothetical protein
LLSGALAILGITDADLSVRAFIEGRVADWRVPSSFRKKAPENVFSR